MWKAGLGLLPLGPVLPEPVQPLALPPALDPVRLQTTRLPWPLRPSFEVCDLAW
jgi:hypothetical protein